MFPAARLRLGTARRSMTPEIGEPPRCLHCGKVPPKVLEQTWAEWEAITFCGTACRRAHHLPRAELLAEVEHPIGSDQASLRSSMVQAEAKERAE